MPKLSERQRLLRDTVDVIAVAIVEQEDDEMLGSVDKDVDAAGEGDDSSLFSEVEDAFDLLQLVESNRYLVPRLRAPKCTQFLTDIFQDSTPESKFRKMTRMSRHSFGYLVREIENHPVFFNESTCPQAPVWLQLAVTLDRFAHYGTGASLERSQGLWGIGKGTVDDYTDRVVLALGELTSKYVRWPGEVERRKISRRMATKGFRGCVGFIDGTTIPLGQKPAIDGECYFDRKQRYSLNAQVVCDDRRKIMAFFSGWPGSCADSTVYKEMLLANNSHKHHFFGPGEYLLADSAYPADFTHNTLVPAYKSSTLGSNIEDFNTCVAHVRVVNEHTIGVLKNRWGCLKELRTQLNTDESMDSILSWITACVTLHNMLIEIKDEWSDDELSTSEDEDDDMLFDSTYAEDEDLSLFRRKVKIRAIAKGREERGILWLRDQQSEM